MDSLLLSATVVDATHRAPGVTVNGCGALCGSSQLTQCLVCFPHGLFAVSQMAFLARKELLLLSSAIAAFVTLTHKARKTSEKYSVWVGEPRAGLVTVASLPAA